MALALLACVALRAQNSEVQGDSAKAALIDSIKLPGSDLKVEDAAKLDVIFVGEIEQISNGPPAEPGTETFTAQVKVLLILHGSVPEEILVKIHAFAMNNEVAPEVGSHYIFFIKKTSVGNTSQNIAWKILPATNDHVIKVKALIAAAPASQ